LEDDEIKEEGFQIESDEKPVLILESKHASLNEWTNDEIVIEKTPLR
jgi:hypothetical protein